MLFCAVATALGLVRTAAPSAVAEKIALRRWIVPQLDGEVVEPRLLIFELDVAVLVNLPRHRRVARAVRATRRHGAMGLRTLVAAHINGGCHERAAYHLRYVHCNRGRALPACDYPV